MVGLVVAEASTSGGSGSERWSSTAFFHGLRGSRFRLTRWWNSDSNEASLGRASTSNEGRTVGPPDPWAGVGPGQRRTGNGGALRWRGLRGQSDRPGDAKMQCESGVYIVKGTG